MASHTSNVVKAYDEIIKRDVKNNAKESLGTIKDIMLDKSTGQVAYVVMDSGSFLGMGGKLFALPWGALHYDSSDDCFLVDMDKETIKKAPGFDGDHWPDMADRTWGKSVATYYKTSGYWER